MLSTGTCPRCTKKGLVIEVSSSPLFRTPSSRISVLHLELACLCGFKEVKKLETSCSEPEPAEEDLRGRCAVCRVTVEYASYPLTSCEYCGAGIDICGGCATTMDETKLRRRARLAALWDAAHACEGKVNEEAPDY